MQDDNLCSYSFFTVSCLSLVLHDLLSLIYFESLKKKKKKMVCSIIQLINLMLNAASMLLSCRKLRSFLAQLHRALLIVSYYRCIETRLKSAHSS